MRFALFISTTFFICVLSNQLAAQNWTVGGTVAPTFANLRHDNEVIELDFDYKIGFAVRTSIGRRLSKHFTLRTGLELEQKGAASEIYFTDENGVSLGKSRATIRNNYLMLPLILEANFGGKVQGIVQLGYTFECLLNSKEVWKIAGEKQRRDNDQFQNFDQSILLAAGLGSQINEKLSWQFLVRYAHGLVNLTKEEYTINGNSYHNRSLSLNLGLLYALPTGQ